jgi:hypothetical protein
MTCPSVGPLRRLRQDHAPGAHATASRAKEPTPQIWYTAASPSRIAQPQPRAAVGRGRARRARQHLAAQLARSRLGELEIADLEGLPDLVKNGRAHGHLLAASPARFHTSEPGLRACVH